MNEVARTTYRLDTYEDDLAQQYSGQDDDPPTKEELSLSYLVMHHPFRAEPGYLRRVNSIEVLFQDNAESPDGTSSPEIDQTVSESAGCVQRRKRSSQISLARSLSADSLASPGLSSGTFCASPTASTFMTRRISRSASRSPAQPIESPTKRAFPSQSPIHEHVDYPSPQDPPSEENSIVIVAKDPKRLGSPYPRTPPKEIHEHSPQVPPSPPPLPPSRGQSSGDNYDNLYDSDPSRSNTSDPGTNTAASRSDSTSTTSSSSQHQPPTTNGKHTKKDTHVHVGTKMWVVVPVVVATLGVALIAGYYCMKRRT